MKAEFLWQRKNLFNPLSSTINIIRKTAREMMAYTVSIKNSQKFYTCTDNIHVALFLEKPIYAIPLVPPPAPTTHPGDFQMFCKGL